MNYTKEETEQIIELYSADPTRENVDRIAGKFNRTPKSIIGKLSREGVYQKSEYLTKSGEKPITKDELVEEIRELLGMPEEALGGLNKAPKDTLKNLSSTLTLTLYPERLNENC